MSLSSAAVAYSSCAANGAGFHEHAQSHSERPNAKWVSDKTLFHVFPFCFIWFLIL